jgi:hypothetical protein
MTDWFFAPDSGRRLATLRILVGAYATIYSIVRLWYLLDLSTLDDERFFGTGILTVLDKPPSASLVLPVGLITIVACAAMTVGWRYRISAPVAAVFLLCTTTYGNSWGQVFHTENLMLLHFAVLAVVPAADYYVLGRRTNATSAESSDERYGWPIKLMVALIVLTYVAAGVAKLRIGGLAWIDGDVLRHQVAFDNLRKIRLDDIHSPLGTWLVQIGWVWVPVGFATLLIELSAPVAFVQNRIRYLWVGAAWLFHVGIATMMAITFPYHLTGIAYAAIMPTDRIAERAATWWKRRRGDAGSVTKATSR